MNALFELQEKIQDTEAAIARAEESFAKNPGSQSAALTFRSILSRKRKLESEFDEIAKRNALDVCSYRMFSESDDQIKVQWFASALFDFQTLFSTVVDGIKNGPKERARIDPVTAAQTAFDFGYCFSGSAGIVMTMPGELVLLGETDFQKSIATIFEMAEAHTSEQIASFAKRIGIASVRKFYRWTGSHVNGGAGADIQWRKNGNVMLKLFAQVPRLQELRQVIEHSSEQTEDVIELTGELVGLDVDTKKFHMKLPEAGDIKGEVSPIIGTKQTVEVPKRYTIEVLVKKQIHYATEKEDTSYLLLRFK